MGTTLTSIDLVDWLKILGPLVGVALSPFIAVLLTNRAAKDRERRDRKFQIFLALMGDRTGALSPESVRLLNTIDVVFSDNRAVRDAWNDFHNITQQGLVGSHGNFLITQSRVAVLRAMAHDLGFGDDLANADLLRVYTPSYLSQEWAYRLMQAENHGGEADRFWKEKSVVAPPVIPTVPAPGPTPPAAPPLV